MTTDAWSIRGIIAVLCLVVLGSTTTLCLLAYQGREIPALLSGLVTTAIALLIPSPLTKAKTDQPVAVTTEPGDAVAVEYADPEAGHADLGLFLVITGAILVAAALLALAR